MLTNNISVNYLFRSHATLLFIYQRNSCFVEHNVSQNSHDTHNVKAFSPSEYISIWRMEIRMLCMNGLLRYSECRAEVSDLYFYVNLLKHKVQYNTQRISLCLISVPLLVLVFSLRLTHPPSPCSISHSLHGSLCMHMGFAKWTHTEYFILHWFPPRSSLPRRAEHSFAAYRRRTGVKKRQIQRWAVVGKYEMIHVGSLGLF